MKLEITVIVDHDDWSDEEYDKKSERKVIVTNSDLIDIIEQNLPLEKGEFIESLWLVKEIK